MFEPERRDLAWVPRWSIMRVNRRQSVAEHCYFVVAYGLEIARLIGWTNYERLHNLAIYLVRHDENESIESDIPGPVKRLTGYSSAALERTLRRRFNSLPVADADLVAIRKVADLVDECLYLAGEINGGNVSVESVLLFAQQRLEVAIEGLPTSDARMRELKRRFDGLVKAELKHRKDVEDL